MNIQLIQYNDSSDAKNTAVTISTFNCPFSLDEFEFNVIDLSAGNMWCYSGNPFTKVDCDSDLKSLRVMVEKKRSSKVIYVLPKNHICSYHYYSHAYHEQVQIKDDLQTICTRILSSVLPNSIVPYNLFFEHTNTTVGSNTYDADFYFEAKLSHLTKSNRSDKVTTVELVKDSVYATTLQITNSEESLLQFVYALFSPKQTSPEPEWMNAVTFFDDDEQKRMIDENKAIILNAEEKITDAKISLQKNARFKSILYTSGNELVEVVFEILEALLDCDLSGFIDEKREDFRIEKETPVFIGEIKGVSTNVKNEYISQVDVHYQKYIDELPKGKDKKDVHQSLIINPFRTKPIAERDPVDGQQIELAERNGCLIIKTETLLKIYEAFLHGQITSEKCIEVFSSHAGLLDISDFN